MSRKSKSHNDKILRRSALSFDRGNGSLDVDHVLRSEPWKNIEKFEKSEAATIQKALNEFDDIITQVKNLEAKGKNEIKTHHYSPNIRAIFRAEHRCMQVCRMLVEMR